MMFICGLVIGILIGIVFAVWVIDRVEGTE